MNIKLMLNTGLFLVKKFSPEICMGLGVIFGAGAIGTAVKSTLKVDEVLEEIDGTVPEEKKRTARTMAFVKLYSPTVACAVASTVSFGAAYGLLKQRNAALATAYMALQNRFNKYRKAVVTEQGQEADGRYFSSISGKVVDEVDADSEVSKILTDADDYCYWFDEASPYWKKSAEENLFFLREVERILNQHLRYKHVITLNDVFEKLGMDKTSEGSVIGWFNKDNQDSYQISFGLENTEVGRRFINGDTNVTILDFNVDGPVYKELDKVSSNHRIVIPWEDTKEYPHE